MNTNGSSVGAVLFRYRLAVVVGLVAVALGYAMWSARHPVAPADGVAALLTNNTRDLADRALDGGALLFGVTGALCFIGGWLRAAGEARLGSVVYGQDAAPRVVTSGPFRAMRHPLYAGAWIFVVAFALPYVPPALAAALAVVAALALRSIAVFEEGALAQKLGDAWTRYAAAVPRFVGVLRALDDDGVRTTARSWALAVLGNLGILAVGAYRMLVGAGLEFRGLKSLTLLCVIAWIVTVVVRRVRA